MVHSPTRHQTLSRQPSVPSLAVGLPPPLPESSIMQPSSPTKKAHGSPRKRIHRGDVSSSAASSDEENDNLQTTPRRKVINPLEVPLPPSTGKKPMKMTLQERLAAAASAQNGGGSMTARVGSSRSIANISSMMTDSSGSQIFGHPRTVLSPQSRSESLPTGRSTTASSSADKVVVCMRVKPTRNPFADIAYEITPTSLSLSDNHPKVKQRGGKAGREEGYTYTFDKLLQHPSTTPELYHEKIAPLVEKAMNGFNSTVFAYGQTGSGKSFTMTGVPEELGIIPCAVDGVFDAITSDRDRAFLLRVSYIEIYNETLRDLLNFKKGPLKDDEKPAIHLAKGKVYVDPLVEEIVSTPEDVMELLEKGNLGRRIGATDWNERSSRSHCVFTIVIESRPRDGVADDDIRLSRLNLIDLAGSEKAVSDSERRGEGKHINQSLLALREVINKLTEKGKATHIPYRNSKLTHLLENALGGDSNICVICTMSAEEEHCAETLETLKFAGRCSQVKTNAKKNVLLSSERALIKAKDQEIVELKQRLQELAGKQPAQSLEVENGMTDLAESVASMEARKAKLREQLARLNGEILISEIPRSGSGLPMASPKPKRRRISDFSALLASGSGRMGLGLGTPKQASDRRAISGMNRLPEEGEEMSGILDTLELAAEGSVAKSFEHDRALAALRRSLALKEEELSLANRNLASALARASQISDRDVQISALKSELSIANEELAAKQSTLEQVESNHRERSSALEEAKTQLTSSIEARTKLIEDLQNKVQDLRQSREELVLEDQGRLDEATARAERFCRERDECQTQLEGKIQACQEQSDENSRLRDQLAVVIAQHTASEEMATAESAHIKDLQAELAALQQQIEESVSADAARRSKMIQLEESNAAANQQRDEGRADLDRFQREAMSNEATVLAELREEMARLRKSHEEDKAGWEQQKMAFEEEVRAEKEQVKSLSQAKIELEEAQNRIRSLDANDDRQKRQLSEAIETLNHAARSKGEADERIRVQQEAIEATERAKDEAERRLMEALQTLEDAAKANGLLEDRAKQEERAKDEAFRERDEARGRLSESDGVGRQLESEVAARTAAEESLKIEQEGRRALAEEHAGLQEKYNDLSKQLEDEVAIKDDLQLRLSSVDEARQILIADLNNVRSKLVDSEDLITRLEQASAGKSDLELRLQAESGTKASLQSELDDIKSKLASSEDSEKQLAEEISAKRELQGQLDETRQAMDHVTVERDEVKRKLAEFKEMTERLAAEMKAKAQLENRLSDEKTARDALSAELEAANNKLAGFDENAKQLENEFAAKVALEHRLAESTGQLNALNQVKNAVEARLVTAQADLEARERQLESESAARAEAEKGRVEIAELRDQALAESEAHKELLEQERRARQVAEERAEGLMTQREANIKAIKGMRCELDAESAAKVEAEKRVVDLLARVDAQARSGSDAAAAAVTARQALQTKLDQLIVEKDQLEGDQTRLRSSHDMVEAALAEAEEKLDELSVKADSISQVKISLEQETAARQAAEKRAIDISQELVSKHESAQKILETELLSLRSEITVMKSDLTVARETAEAERSRANRLGMELAQRPSIATSSSSPRLHRSALEPGAGMDKEMCETVKEGMKQKIRRGHSVSAGSGRLDRDSSLVMLRQREDEEFDRLEMVIEAQKEIIDEQREKIERWAKEMEKQREFVRMLTSDPSVFGTPLPASKGSPRGHAKSHSISHSPIQAPVPIPARGIVPSFTARNLALPTTPTPLPMHPSQVSNASLRKSRRVTIEHDIDRLAESSKVNRGKAIFESPDKAASSPVPATPPRAPLRAAQSVRSVPRQRRP
ncbi:hypothetical protein IAU60_003921 [Kwoniella sp. DSM 27419]